MRSAASIVLALLLSWSAAACVFGEGVWSAPLPEVGMCIAGLHEDEGILEGYQPFECRHGLIWRVDKVFQGDDRCPEGTEVKLIENVKSEALHILWHVCLTRL